MLNVAVVDNTLRLGIKLSKIINYTFNFNTKSYDFKQFHFNKLIIYKTDVLFLDISETPKRSLEIIKKIRSNPETEKLSLVLTTGFPQKDILIELLKFGIIEIIIKPYDYEKLPEQLKVIFKKAFDKKNLSLQDLLEKKINSSPTFTDIPVKDIQLIKKNYELLIKDVLRQEFRTKIKTIITFNSQLNNVINEAVVYTSTYNDNDNTKYILTFISTYNDILSIFSKNYNKKAKNFDYEILQLCDEFSQSVFNRLLTLLRNVIKGFVKIETNFAFYNSYEVINENSLVFKFFSEMNHQFIFTLKRDEWTTDP